MFGWEICYEIGNGVMVVDGCWVCVSCVCG